ncbi:MAG: hypothetical protein JST84_26855 [Acidobacteria bacterium]|nr:hypothetical protein [Acidobacteriota bacterium]
MGAVRDSNRQETTSGQVAVFPPVKLLEKRETDQVQETIWQLQDEVKRLQEELARTRRALDQRIILLQNSQVRERELRSEGGVR